MTTISPTQDMASQADAAQRPLVLVGAVAGAVAAAATTLVAVAAKAVDVPLEAAPRNADAAKEIPMSGFATGTLMMVAVGIVIALLLAWKAKRPARTWVITTVVLTVISFAGPISTGHATTATRLVLGLTHVVAAAIVIPAIAHRLAQQPARR